MRCLSCGKEIPESKRMCDECAAEMVSKLIEHKKAENKKSKGFQFPNGAPKGVVKSWKPKGR
ncbi:MAG: hypothetical protein FJ044_00925 [Candidatus Cloacimonetes bacterium]|nr:hypothetical protein [Candidatus Cloacimonadota bacterium]